MHGHDKMTFLAEPEAFLLMSMLLADHCVKHDFLLLNPLLFSQYFSDK